MTTQHAQVRQQQRHIYVDAKVNNLASQVRTSAAILLGRNRIAIVRQGDIVTVMYRRSGSVVNTQALRVNQILYA